MWFARIVWKESIIGKERSNEQNSNEKFVEYLDKFFEYTNMSLENFASDVIAWFGYDAFIEFLDRQMQLYDVYDLMEENGELENEEEDY